VAGVVTTSPEEELHSRSEWAVGRPAVLRQQASCHCAPAANNGECEGERICGLLMVNSMRRERVALKYDFRQQALGMSRRHISAHSQLDHITSTPLAVQTSQLASSSFRLPVS
jgi:hypothetical protein